MGPSHLLKPWAATAASTSTEMYPLFVSHRSPLKRAHKPYTTESVPPNKKTILNDKSTLCSNGSLRAPSTVTSHQASTTSVKASRGFWNTSKQAWSRKLWWPTVTASRDLESNSLNGSSSEPGPLSLCWSQKAKVHKKSSVMTSWQSSTFSLVGRTENEGTARGKSLVTKAKRLCRQKNIEYDKSHNHLGKQLRTRCRLVAMFPSPIQSRVLHMWFRDARTTYNLALAEVLRLKLHLRLHMAAADVELRGLEKLLNAKFVPKKSLLEGPFQRLLRTPKVIRQQAIKTLMASLKTQRTKIKQWQFKAGKTGTTVPDKKLRFRPMFKTKKMTTTDSIALEKISFRMEEGGGSCRIYGSNYAPFRSKMYPMRGLKLASSSQLQEHGMVQDFKIHYRHGKFHLIVPMDHMLLDRRKPVHEDREQVVALDPGVRKFLTGYSPEGSLRIYGARSYRPLDRLARQEDRRKRALTLLVSRYQVLKESTESRKDRKRLRHALWLRKRKYHLSLARSKNVVKDFHYKVAHDLCRSYKKICLPFTSSHWWREGHRLHTKTKRRSMMLAFGQFRHRLVETATWYPGVEIIGGSEAYTSKQCGQCGHLHEKLGSNKLFQCPSCAHSSDRDVHGARNILLRFLL